MVLVACRSDQRGKILMFLRSYICVLLNTLCVNLSVVKCFLFCFDRKLWSI